MLKNSIKSLIQIFLLPLYRLNCFVKKTCEIVLSILRCCKYLKSSKGISNSITPLEFVRPDVGCVPEVNALVHPIPILDLTIIVPMYNSEQYVEACLDSILCQKTKYSYEVVLVDDGSIDHTLEIVSKYSSDRRIHIMKLKHHGQAYARNRAIECASGKYIMMVDSDDLISEDCVECLLNAALSADSDIAEGTVQRFIDQFEIVKPKKNRIVVKDYLSNPKFVLRSLGYSVAKVYKRELWLQLRYPEGYIFEDVITKFILRRKANHVISINNVIYGYRYDVNSSSHKLDGLKHLDSIWVYNRIVSLCESEGVPFDEVFYLLSINHIGILNYITTLHLADDIKESCFIEMQKQLNSIQFCRPKRLPFLFRLLEKSIISGKMDAWQEVAKIIIKYKLLKKWREIN